MPRFQKHLFICNNKRTEDDPRGSCSACGSDDLLDYAKGRIHEMGLKGKVRVNKAGCLDACAHGPAMVVYPDDVWYSPKTKEDMEEIIKEHVQNNRTANRLVIEFKKKN
ncbi:MAG TPA: (2Fe-2S) ferredoxin domain-containing protein [Nitrospinaceae bacterium]|jgi:(2Fe-2S) ferredoxin|nr:ferredoxin [Nitrospinota bacterium]MDP6335330.1 (2Fe-2S) ferredoxin domain-containing protein [Nitrospinaceae bacterium]MDP7147643.1 (2Fe-2S) ferredoxin domain-containing protein [Nitrospinaceae bacterium]HAX46684.1 ferredoxin [Nitrospina sp.]HJO59028.1 (2Fe-2S) ferredoxin domain-containing protein [Nitrospinaceae bacterium]|tara:strand:+ start:4871 stop:5197 length:327 start_codon:yes stop_codon:yes gene_type:complete